MLRRMDDKLWDILPKFYEYKIVSFEETTSNDFDATFRVNLFDERAVINWLKQFELCSLTNFRVARTVPAKQTRVLFKKYYRCHHNTRASEIASKTKKAHIKHTGCEATLLITVNNSCMKSCKQPDVKRFPCTVKYHNFHNHPFSSDELLCHRKPIERIEKKIRELLLKNHTPVSALKILKQDLQQEFKDEYTKIIKDGAFCPKLQWIYHKYYSIFKEMCTDPYKIKYFPSEMMIEECEDTDSDSENNQITVPVSQEQFSLNENPNSSSIKDEDMMYDEYISSPSDKLLFENHFVEVYTLGQNDLIEEENEDVFISEENLTSLPLIADDNSNEDYNELPVVKDCMPTKQDHDTSSDAGKSILIVDGKMETSSKNVSSKLWSDVTVKQKVIELNEDDLSEIFGDNCGDMKINDDIFLPSIKDEIQTYKTLDT